MAAAKSYLLLGRVIAAVFHILTNMTPGNRVLTLGLQSIGSNEHIAPFTFSSQHLKENYKSKSIT